MSPEDLAVEEADGDLARRRVRQLLVALKLDPFDGGQRDPGRLVVLQATGVVHLDEEVRLVEIEIAGHPFNGLVVEEGHEYPGHLLPNVLTHILPLSSGGSSGRRG